MANINLKFDPAFPQPNSVVTKIRAYNGVVYIAGGKGLFEQEALYDISEYDLAFYEAGGGSARDGLAAIDIRTKTILPFNINAFLSTYTQAVIKDFIILNQIIYAVGVCNTGALRVAVDLNGVIQPWVPDFQLLSPVVTPDAKLYTIGTDNVDIYIGGEFDTVNGTSVENGLVKVDAALGNLVPWAGFPVSSYGNFNITSLDASATTVYAVGQTLPASLGFAVSASFSGVIGPWAGYVYPPNGMVVPDKPFKVKVGRSGGSVVSDVIYLSGQWGVFPSSDGVVVRTDYAGNLHPSFSFGTAYPQGNPGEVWGHDLQPYSANLYLDSFSATNPLETDFNSISLATGAYTDLNLVKLFSSVPLDVLINSIEFYKFAHINDPCVFLGGNFETIDANDGDGVQARTYLAAFNTDVRYRQPLRPKIKYLLRKKSITLLEWNTVFLDVDYKETQVDGYRVYRSTNENLEEYELIAEITTLSANNQIDTAFSEVISGFYGYAVTAFIEDKESEMSFVNSLDSTFNLDTPTKL